MSDPSTEIGAARPLRVLLVDDHEDSTELLQILLSRQGFAVTTAHSVATALEAVELRPIDVLVSDINLPDGNGCDLLRQLRGSGRLPAIALSGNDSASDVQRGIGAGFDEYLGKPVHVSRLVDTIRRLSTS